MAAAPTTNPGSIVNLNVGVMGHVDSGKTSLVKALSTHLSTASIDKHPQSQERGITLDLGFSAFTMPLPTRFLASSSSSSSAVVAPPGVDTVQVTLVDCPGHGSLIRTIIGGAHIIDMVLLVVDVTRGIQAQTVECLIIAEITTQTLVIVLNKIDLLPAEDRARRVEEAITTLRRSLRASRFSHAPIVPLAAAVGGEKVAAATNEGTPGAKGWGRIPHLGLEDLGEALRASMRLPRRLTDGPLYLAVDHCFPIKGQGTVLTGTVLSGKVAVNDVVELPVLGESRKVKSIQMFHQSVKRAQQGDRVGVCVTNLDSKSIERGVVCTPGSIKRVDMALAVIKKIRAFRGRIKTGDKVHVSVGHVTVMAKVVFFGAKELQEEASSSASSRRRRRTGHGGLAASLGAGEGEEGGVEEEKEEEEEEDATVPRIPYDWEKDFLYQEEMAGRIEEEEAEPPKPNSSSNKAGEDGKAVARRRRPLQPQYALLMFESPVLCPVNSLLIGSRLDADPSGVGTNSASSRSSSGQWVGGCRLAFCGTLLEVLKEEDLRRVLIYKPKVREGSVYRLGEQAGAAVNGQVRYREVTGQGFFKKETVLEPFVGMYVETSDVQVGRLESGFGKGGKVRVRFEGAGATGVKVGDKLYLRFQRFIHDPAKKMVQKRRELLVQGQGQPLSVATTYEKEEDEEEEEEEERNVVDADGEAESKATEGLVGVDLSVLETATATLQVDGGGAAGGAERVVRPPASSSTSTSRAPAPAAPRSPTLPVQSAVGDMELRFGTVDAVRQGDLVIAKGFFSMEEDIRKYVGLRVVPTEGEAPEGCVVGPFGKGGKAKVQFSSTFAGTVGTPLTLYFSLPVRSLGSGNGSKEDLSTLEGATSTATVMTSSTA